jgi:selenocysteine lyase/cysteine desulfurase
VGLAGLKAALEMILDLNPDAIERELRRKRNLLVSGLHRQNYTVLNPTEDALTSGPITTFYKEGHDMGQLHQKLTEANIVTSLRVDRSGRKYLRRHGTCSFSAYRMGGWATLRTSTEH